MTKDEIRQKLLTLTDNKYKKFSSKLIPNEKTIIGVRVPDIRRLAKDVSQENPMEYLNAAYTDYHEECLLYGLVLGLIKTDIHTLLSYIDNWLNCVNNWAVCDSGIMSIKALGKPQNKIVVWDYIINKLKSTDKPFVKRAMIVMLFSYFNTDDYHNKVLKAFMEVRDDHYYVQMAIAWGISVIATKYFEDVVITLKEKKFDLFIHNKSIQKCCESYRISIEEKQRLKEFKL